MPVTKIRGDDGDGGTRSYIESLGPVLLPILDPQELGNLLGLPLSDKATAHTRILSSLRDFKKGSALLHPLPDQITQVLLNRPLHGTGSESLGNPLPDEHLDGHLIYCEFYTHLLVTLHFFPNHD